MHQKIPQNFMMVTFLLDDPNFFILFVLFISLPLFVFFKHTALKGAGTIKDCVNPLNPLEIQHRTRLLNRPLDYACLADVYGLEWPEGLEETLKICPGDSCLRSFGCFVVSYFISFYFFFFSFLSFFFSFFFFFFFSFLFFSFLSFSRLNLLFYFIFFIFRISHLVFITPIVDNITKNI